MKENRAIVTGIFGHDYWQIANVSLPTIRNYANRIGAELVVLEERQFPEWKSYWEKLWIGRLLVCFDTVAWIDVDTIVSSKAPDIFSECNPVGLSAFDEGAIFADRSQQLVRDAGFYDLECILARPRSFTYFNSGVMVAGKPIRSLFTPPRRAKGEPMSEQTFLNLRLIETAYPFHDLTSKWNGLHSIHGPGDRRDLNIVHYAGWPRTFDWIERMTLQMNIDLEAWKS